MKSRQLIGLVIFFLSSALASADTYKYVYGDEFTFPDIANWSLQARQQRKDDVEKFLMLTRTNITKLALAAGGEPGYRKMLQAVEDARLDKQVGAPPSAAGTTSVVSKSAASQILALAVEQGALSRSDNQSVATFRGNALGIGRFLVGAEQLPYCAIFDDGCRGERRLEGASFSASFDTSPESSSAKTGATTGNAALTTPGPRFSGWTVRYDFNVRAKISAADYISAIEGIAAGPAAQFLADAETLLQPVKLSPEFQQWSTKVRDALLNDPSTVDDPKANSKGFEAAMTQAAIDLVAIAHNAVPDFDTKLDAFVTSMGSYFGARDKAFETLLSRMTYSLEYDNERFVNQPDQSSIKLIIGGRLDQAGRHQLTFNSTASWYDNSPPQGAVRRFRDAQAALQADFSMTPDSTRVGASVSAGYYFQWMADNALLTIPSSNLAPGTSIPLSGDASVLLATKGTISIGQIAVTLAFKNGVKLPIALSFANRSELLKASNVRGHFGLTYDIASLFAGK